MNKTNKNKKKRNSRGVTGSDHTRIPLRAYIAGAIMLTLSSVMSLMLVLDHFGAMQLPGCGPGSGCAEAAAGPWGKVPYVEWPVSFLGLAYFLGVLAVWLTSRAGLGAGMRVLVRFGVLISIGFSIVLLVEKLYCGYCVTAHAGNLAFWIVMELSRTRGIRLQQGFLRYAVVFIFCSAVLGVWQAGGKAVATARAEEKLADATAALIAGGSTSASNPDILDIGENPDTEPISESSPAGDSDVAPATGAAARRAQNPKPFTGRYRLGPEEAAIRIVLIGDYQCQECKRIEEDVMRVFKQRQDMSVSFKHFPMCSDCNRMTNTRRHPNACWAARAAEAAGLLRGQDGFWQMHFWLYERGGSFTNQDFPPELRKMGYDAGEFIGVMNGEQVLDLIKQDVEEAVELGIWFTPSIFINGVELRGWEAPNAVERAIAALAATNPPPRSAAADLPPRAVEKLIGDWLDKPLRSIPQTESFRILGRSDAPVRIVLFGDYLHKGTADLDRLIRGLVAQRDDVRYEYRHFPFNQECNLTVKVKTDYQYSCLAAQAGEAAGRSAGAEAYWKMHVWLLEHQEDFSEAALPAAASSAGIGLEELQAAMQAAETARAVQTDTLLGGRIRATSVPTLFVNGRHVPRWMREGENILPQIVERAAQGTE